jgi:hypothetical protein
MLAKHDSPGMGSSQADVESSTLQGQGKQWSKSWQLVEMGGGLGVQMH